MKLTFKETIAAIKEDIPTGYSFRNFVKSYFFSPGFRVLFNHRLGKYFFYSGFVLFRVLALHYKKVLIVKRGCDISYSATIGRKVKFPHPIGIVIGDGVVIGDNVKIWQQVTFGSHGKKGENLKYPIIHDNVKIYAGAKIIGASILGEGAVIGANSVVNINVPEHSTAVGVPCKIIEKK
jgi:serine O-acetyltransferase